MTAPETAPAEQAKAFYERVLELNAGLLDIAALTLGFRLGLYEALDRLGTATAGELATATETGERYVREWLAHMTVANVLEIAEEGDARTRRYRIPPGYRAVLVDEDDPRYLLPITQVNVGLASSLDPLEEGFRTDTGVRPEAYASDVAAGAATMNRPAYVGHLTERWIPGIPALHERLGEDPQARVADVGCGSGWALISLAKAYPNVEAEGIDNDADAIETATANAAAEGVADRVHFEVRDADDPQLQGRYDLVTVFESLHHFPDPAGALGTLRGLLREDGVVLLTELRCEEAFTAPGDVRERTYHGWSVLNCLPKSRSVPDSEAPGAVLRPNQVAEYGQAAGFSDVEPLDLDSGGYFWRFYRLTP
jgi:2-polyprenyl-3-methyl-5-hydroxy-6-metoxy-1,4-benzoquinol methylase